MGGQLIYLRGCLKRSDRVFRSATVQDARSDDEGHAAHIRGGATPQIVPSRPKDERRGFLNTLLAVCRIFCRNYFGFSEVGCRDRSAGTDFPASIWFPVENADFYFAGDGYYVRELLD
jgi:hypothetical protein